MTGENLPISDKYYHFWLFDWGPTTIDVLSRVRPRYVLCQLNYRQISFHGDNSVGTIDITNIKNLRVWRWASAGAKVTVNVEIQFASPLGVKGEDNRIDKLFLVPIDVFTFDTSLEESKAMIKVIEAFQNGTIPNIEPNPYLRCRQPRTRIPRNKPDVHWNPTVPPYIYSEPTYSSRRLWIVLFAWIVLVPVITLVLGLILNALLGQR